MNSQSKKLALVVGAGASHEIGLPTGDKLKSRISELLDIRYRDGYRQSSGDYVICEAIKQQVRALGIPRGDISPHLHAARLVSGAMPQAISIDNFLDSHQGNGKIELCGKLAIVRAILSAESQSRIYINPTSSDRKIGFASLENCWLNPFFRVLTQNCKAEDLSDRFRKLSLVVFNYDRCIEHYLYHALQNYYGMNGQAAAQLVNDIEIFHPYGSVGPLEWQTEKEQIPFGEEPSGSALLAMSQRIRTFTEGTDPNSSEIAAIRSAIASAEKIVFLGFAFNPLNMSLIQPDPDSVAPNGLRRIYATAHGISKSDAAEIAAELAHIGKFGSNQVEVRPDLVCAKIFAEYSRGISLAQ